MIKNKQKGFTIVELMIATTVFGFMILFVASGLIGIGRMYYKGVLVQKTQETTRGVVTELTRSVQYAGPVPIVTSASTATPQIDLGVIPGTSPVQNFYAKAVCVGNQRFTYVIGRRIDQSSSAKHALWVDLKNQGAECVPLNLSQDDPSNPSTGNTSDSSASGVGARRELLASNMRLAVFDVQPAAEKSADIKVKVMYGADDLLNGLDLAAYNNSLAGANCTATRAGGQFCAFSRVDTFVTRRL